MKILKITPSFLSVRLEKEVSKTFTVHVPYQGEPATGHLALAPETEPSEVTLTGAQSMIEGIQQVRTKAVDLSGTNESFKKQVPLDLETALPYTASSAMFTVSIPIRQQTITKIIENIPIQIWNTSAEVKIEPSVITVEIKGPFDTLGNKAVTDQVYAFMDMKGLAPGVYARHAYINVPVGLSMTGADPKVFTVKIK